MDLTKNYTEVLIDGKVYMIGGAEDSNYIQKVAGYVSRKRGELRRQPGFLKQKEDYQALMIEINMADDYFKAQEKADSCKRQKEEADRDVYGIKHELIGVQMKLEEAQSRIEELEKALRDKDQEMKEAVRQAAEEAARQERELARAEAARQKQALADEAASQEKVMARQAASQEWKLAQEEAAAAETEKNGEEGISDRQRTPEGEADLAEQEERLRIKEELEKQKAIQAAKLATEQYFRSHVIQGRNHQSKK